MSGSSWSATTLDSSLPPTVEAPPVMRVLTLQSSWRVDGVAGRESGGLLRLHWVRGGRRAFLAIPVQPVGQALYDPGRGTVVLSDERLSIAPWRFSWLERGGLVGDYQVGLGEVMRIGRDDGARPARDWRLEALNGRLRPQPALRGLAWEGGGGKGIYLSRRLLDVYQYRLRYRPDPWGRDTLPECTSVGRRWAGFTCEADGMWYGQGVNDLSGAPRYGVVLPGVVRESLAAGVWRGARFGAAAYGARLDWRLTAPEVEMVGGDYPVGGRFGAVGGWGRFGTLEVAVVRSLGGWAWRVRGRTGKRRWVWWHYDADYRNPYAGGPLARPWDRRRDQQGVRLTGGQRRWRLQLWSRSDGEEPAVSGRLRFGGENRRRWFSQGTLRVATRWGTAGYRRGEFSAQLGFRGSEWSWRGGGGLTILTEEGGQGRRLRLGGEVSHRVGSGVWSLRWVVYFRDPPGRRMLGVGDGDRLRCSWRGSRGAVGIWVGRDGRRALWMSWRAQKSSKP